MIHKLRVAAHAFTWVARIILTITAMNLGFTWVTERSSGWVLMGSALLLITALCWWVWFYDHVLVHLKRPIHPLIWVTVLLLAMVGCTRVPPGYVGIKVNYYGSQRGVDDFPVFTGFAWFNPITTSIFEYPTFVQTAIWTSSRHEGKPVNEEISFNSREGLVFTADISLSYSLEPSRVPHFYVQFRSDNLDHFTHGFLRNVARDHFNEVATHFTAEEIYGEKKEQYLAEVKQRINLQMAPYGVLLQQFGFIGAPRPPDSVRDAINGKIKAIQDAIRVENEVRQAKAEAQKLIARSEGEARANQILTASITPSLIEWRRLELTNQAILKWNGQRPMVEGQGSGLLFNVTPRAEAFPR